MNIKKIKQARSELNKSKRTMANERDKLRAMIESLEELDGTYEEAIDNLERAADCLSEIV